MGQTASYVVTGLTNGQEYFFKVAATNSVGTGAYSAEDSVTLEEPVSEPAEPVDPPAAPTSLTVAASAASPTSAMDLYRGQCLLTTEVLLRAMCLSTLRTEVRLCTSPTTMAHSLSHLHDGSEPRHDVPLPSGSH